MQKISRILFLALMMVSFSCPIYAAEEAGGYDAKGKGEAAKKDDGHGGGEGGGEEGGKKKEPSDVSGGRFAGDPIYVHMDPLVFPIITDDGVQQIVTMQVTIEVNEFNTVDEIHTSMPRVRDTLTTSVYGGLSDGSLRQGNMLNMAKVKVKMLSSLKGVVGDEKIRDVLIEGIAQRMF